MKPLRCPKCGKFRAPFQAGIDIADDHPWAMIFSSHYCNRYRDRRGKFISKPEKVLQIQCGQQAYGELNKILTEEYERNVKNTSSYFEASI
jgi:hypothetical protein